MKKAVRKAFAAKSKSAKVAGHWFYSKTPAAKKEYIAKHPNSIYAKQKQVAALEVKIHSKKSVKKGGPGGVVKPTRDDFDDQPARSVVKVVKKGGHGGGVRHTHDDFDQPARSVVKVVKKGGHGGARK
jgi:hypothetical protein